MTTAPTDRRHAAIGVDAPVLTGLQSADRVAERLHVAFACLYFALAGLATSTESIAFVLVAAVAAVRLPTLWRFWATQVRSPILIALGAWIAWTALSLLWSPDRSMGMSMLKGIRGVVLIFAIAPVASHWRLLVSSLLLGLSVQAVIQLGQAVGIVAPHHRNDLRHPGLYSHPGHLGLFHAAAVVLGIAWIATLCHDCHARRADVANLAAPPESASRRRCWSGVLLLTAAVALCAAGLGITAGRAAILGLVVALPVMMVVQLWSWCASKRVFFGMLAAIAMALALVVSVPLMLDSAGWNMQFGQFRNLGDAGSSGGSRLVYWSAAAEAWQREPFMGVGAGGTHDALSTTARVADALERTPDRDLAFFAPIHPHSLYVQTLLEGGVIGAAILLVFLAFVGRQALRRCRDLPIAAGVLGALLVWAVAAGFDALHVSGRTASLACALVALTWAGRGRETPCRNPLTEASS